MGGRSGGTTFGIYIGPLKAHSGELPSAQCALWGMVCHMNERAQVRRTRPPGHLHRSARALLRSIFTMHGKYDPRTLKGAGLHVNEAILWCQTIRVGQHPYFPQLSKKPS